MMRKLLIYIRLYPIKFDAHIILLISTISLFIACNDSVSTPHIYSPHTTSPVLDYFGEDFLNEFNFKTHKQQNNWPKLFYESFIKLDEPSINQTNQTTIRVSKLNTYDQDFLMIRLSATKELYTGELKINFEKKQDSIRSKQFEILETEFDTIVHVFKHNLSILPKYTKASECCDGWCYLFELKTPNSYQISAVYEPHHIREYDNLISIISIIDQYLIQEKNE